MEVCLLKNQLGDNLEETIALAEEHQKFFRNILLQEEKIKKMVDFKGVRTFLLLRPEVFIATVHLCGKPGDICLTNAHVVAVAVKTTRWRRSLRRLIFNDRGGDLIFCLCSHLYMSDAQRTRKV